MTEIADEVEQLATLLDLPFAARNLDIVPGPDLFGSPYRVADAAAISVGAATCAVAALHAARAGTGLPVVHVDARHAAATFHSERLLAVPDVEGAELWDPVTGNYATADGWVRLHANVSTHRAAALQILGVEADRQAVTRAAREWRGDELEESVLSAGGVAAVLRTREQWQEHPQRTAVLRRPVVDITVGTEGRAGEDDAGLGVLEGVRVVDLTRVIAGPVAGRFLASFGADVLRVDAPNLDDMLRFEIDTSFGKRRTTLDLHEDEDRRLFEQLVREADVLLEAFRPTALTNLGYDDDRLRELRPGLVTGRLSAYGGEGPWGGRRGFDSVVQLACGIAHACGHDPDRGPSALPAQALDHASGYLLAAGVIAALAHRRGDGRARTATVSLARTAEWLGDLGVRDGLAATTVDAPAVEDVLEWRHGTPWGPVRHVRAAGAVGERRAHWALPPVPRAPQRSHVSGYSTITAGGQRTLG